MLTGQLLDILEREHNEYVGKEELDINMEPEKLYINEFKDKLNRTRDKHKTRLGILTANSAQSTTAQPGQEHPSEDRHDIIPGEDELGEGKMSVSR